MVRCWREQRCNITMTCFPPTMRKLTGNAEFSSFSPSLTLEETSSVLGCFQAARLAEWKHLGGYQVTLISGANDSGKTAMKMHGAIASRYDDFQRELRAAFVLSQNWQASPRNIRMHGSIRKLRLAIESRDALRKWLTRL